MRLPEHDFADDELWIDRRASLDDMIVCLAALQTGVKYSGLNDDLSTKDRLEKNAEIVNRCNNELARRGFDPAGAPIR